MKKNGGTSVDVIIPTYNSLPWLEDSIHSVLSQSYDNLLLYIIDDGSTDKTEDFVLSLRDKRIKYIKKTNSGVSATRNYGIRASSSPYVAFLDADDVWHEDKLKKQMDLISKVDDIGLVYGHTYNIGEDGVILSNLRNYYSGHISEVLANGNFISGSASMVLIPRKVFEDVGVFREDFVNGEDWELWFRISKKYKIDFVPEILASIRQHPGNSQNNTKKMTDGLVHAYHEMKQSLDLTKTEQRLLASYCLFNSAVEYYKIGERKLARKTLFALFRENPPAKSDFEHWLPHINFGVFSKILFSNIVFDYLSKRLDL